jgi:hypothetical protein
MRRRTATPVSEFAPSLLAALDEQLGLKLDARRAPIEYVVIDSAEPPIETSFSSSLGTKSRSGRPHTPPLNCDASSAKRPTPDSTHFLILLIITDQYSVSTKMPRRPRHGHPFGAL